MRKKHSPRAKAPQPGDTRIRTRFLWLPLRLPTHADNGEDEETRWFESADIVEIYRETFNWNSDGGRIKTFGWCPQKWAFEGWSY